MNARVEQREGAEAEPRFLLEWSGPSQPQRVVRAGVLSILAHAVGLVAISLLPDTAPPRAIERPLLADLRKSTPLIAPPPELTQREANRGAVSKELNLEGLLPRPRIAAPAGPPPGAGRPVRARPFSPPPQPTAPAPAPVPPRLEAPPKVEAQSLSARITPQMLPPGVGTPAPAPAPPQIVAEEKPKLAFETPGGGGSSHGSGIGLPSGRIPMPNTSVQEAVRSVARGGAGGGLVVGDADQGLGGIGAGLNLPPSQGRIGSSLELLSDPMGVDFKPYLIKILSSVRRNWFAVIPESAKLGRRGRVQIQFSISREGRVPKLVIALPSGSDALDRAAVAGISASNPFPPLPSDFRGEQVRLQFTFLYNIR